MELNYIAILVATLLQFICGALWYMPLFGKVWGAMHGFDALTPEVQKEMQRKMMPLLVVQFLATLVTTFVFALFVTGLRDLSWNIFGIAGFFWLGFIVPTQVSAVLFGGTEPKWILRKIGIMAGGSFVCMMAAASVFHFMA